MERWRAIDDAPPELARALLATCCGSHRWIERMLALRPFGTRERMLAAAREEWFALTAADWREAFAHHPRIGGVDALRAKFAATAAMSAREQAGVAAAPPDVLDALLAANRAYEARFGYIFIVCASGRSAAGMLAILQARLANAPETEIGIAAEEHARICELRLLAPA
jgi:2-oxo-4-hydroxy-4-carboxy-5-ureidoimidazoline decarboxylase